METEAEPLMPEVIPQAQAKPSETTAIGKLPWIPLAAASGACAAFNGVFAKLYVMPLTRHVRERAMLMISAPQPSSPPPGPPASQLPLDYHPRINLLRY